MNKIIKRDIYSMSLQVNVIVLIIDCFYISVFDAVNFFYQWLMQIANRHKLIVILYWKQKQFNVAVMKYINSSIYVQQKINVIFRVFRIFVKAYVNDIVIFNKTLKKHLTHLHQIFQFLNSYNIRLSSKKSYLRYFIVALLNQKMNVFDFIIVADKLTTIINLRFLYTLKNLKSYLSFIDWLRNYIVWYIQKSNSLQFRKTMLFRSLSSNKKRQRKIYFVKIILKKFFETEIKFYNQLQKAFDKTKLFIHYDLIRITYIDVNVFKRRDFDVVIYHLKSDANLNNFKQEKIQSIMFLNRMFIIVEKRYWSTKLKMIDLIWVMRKARHIIETSQHFIIVFTNHVVNAFIIKQTTFSFNNIDKLNLRLMRVSTYFSQFQLNVRYRFDKRHVLFDVLSRLSIDRFFFERWKEFEFEKLSCRHEKFFSF